MDSIGGSGARRQLADSGEAFPSAARRERTCNRGTTATHQVQDGALLVDGQSGVLFANAAAEAMLARRDALRLDRRRLAAARMADTAAIRRLVAAADREDGGPLVISRNERPSLLLLVVPLRAQIPWLGDQQPCAIVFVKDLGGTAELSLSAFLRHYRLTPAQAALMREIIKGDGVAAAGARLGIAYGTARSHLLQIYQKTGVRRQAELVRLAFRWTSGMTEP
jgi:DNA-binding CsgD family transcriptional regulator